MDSAKGSKRRRGAGKMSEKGSRAGVAWVLQRAGFHSLVMAVSARLSSFKFCSLLISSGVAGKITLRVAWVL